MKKKRRDNTTGALWTSNMVSLPHQSSQLAVVWEKNVQCFINIDFKTEEGYEKVPSPFGVNNFS